MLCWQGCSTSWLAIFHTGIFATRNVTTRTILLWNLRLPLLHSCKNASYISLHNITNDLDFWCRFTFHWRCQWIIHRRNKKCFVRTQQSISFSYSTSVVRYHIAHLRHVIEWRLVTVTLRPLGSSLCFVTCWRYAPVNTKRVELNTAQERCVKVDATPVLSCVVAVDLSQTCRANVFDVFELRHDLFVEPSSSS